MLLVRDSIVERVFVSIKLDLVVQFDKVFKLQSLILVRILWRETIETKAQRTLNFVKNEVESRAMKNKMESKTDEQLTFRVALTTWAVCRHRGSMDRQQSFVPTCPWDLWTLPWWWLDAGTCTPPDSRHSKRYYLPPLYLDLCLKPSSSRFLLLPCFPPCFLPECISRSEQLVLSSLFPASSLLLSISVPLSFLEHLSSAFSV